MTNGSMSLAVVLAPCLSLVACTPGGGAAVCGDGTVLRDGMCVVADGGTVPDGMDAEMPEPDPGGQSDADTPAVTDGSTPPDVAVDSGTDLREGRFLYVRSLARQVVYTVPGPGGQLEWREVTPAGFGTRPSSLVVGGEGYFLTPALGEGAVYSSEDGVSWQLRERAGTTAAVVIGYCGDRFFVQWTMDSAPGETVYEFTTTSDGGDTWDASGDATDISLTVIACIGDTIVGPGGYSTDGGDTWSAHSDADLPARGPDTVLAADGVFLGVKGDSSLELDNTFPPVLLFSSSDGIAWEPLPPPPFGLDSDVGRTSVAHDGAFYIGALPDDAALGGVAATNAGRYYRSTDGGSTWDEGVARGWPGALGSTAAGDGWFVNTTTIKERPVCYDLVPPSTNCALQEYGLRSTDGLTWTEFTPPNRLAAGTSSRVAFGTVSVP